MEIKSLNTDGTVFFSFSRDELVLLNNALNEVCHGIKIPSFSSRLGATREEAEDMLRQISGAIDALDNLPPT